MLILIPNYNKGEYINETIKSLKAQTYQDFVIWILDDGSTDNSLDNAREGNEDTPIIEWILEHEGISSTLNFGMQEAIQAGYKEAIIIASDDTVAPTWVEELIKCKQETNADFITTAGVRFGSAEEEFRESSAGMYSTKMWEDIGGRDENEKFIGDAVMKLEMYKRGYKKAVVNKPLYHWRSYSNQSSRMAGDTTKEIKKHQERLNLTDEEVRIALTQPF